MYKVMLTTITLGIGDRLTIKLKSYIMLLQSGLILFLSSHTGSCLCGGLNYVVKNLLKVSLNSSI